MESEGSETASVPAASPALRRRLYLVIVISVCYGFSAGFYLAGYRDVVKGIRSEVRTENRFRQTSRYLSGLSRELTAAILDSDKGASERHLPKIQELSEELHESVRLLVRLSSSSGLRREVEEEDGEVQAAIGALGGQYTKAKIETALVRLDTLSERIEEVRDRIEKTEEDLFRKGVDRLVTSSRFAAVGTLATLVLLVLVFFDVLDALQEPLVLEEELAAVSENAEFRSRIAAITGESPEAASRRRWDVRLTRILSDCRTHVSFEAVAVSDCYRVELWGKLYKWAGHVKSFQRLFTPAFGRVSWRILLLLHGNSVSCPVPVVYRKIGGKGYTRGALMLASHVGPVTSLKQFLRSGFGGLSADRRLAFCEALAAFVSSLHRLGVCNFKPRYLYLRAPASGSEREAFYLFDLDKAFAGFGGPGFVGRFLQRRDLRRLRRLLAPYLTLEEREAFDTALAVGRLSSEADDLPTR